jgi:hypothetical protein
MSGIQPLEWQRPVVVACGHGLPLKDGKVYAGAGYYLNELTVPVRALMNEGV